MMRLLPASVFGLLKYCIANDAGHWNRAWVCPRHIFASKPLGRQWAISEEGGAQWAVFGIQHGYMTHMSHTYLGDACGKRDDNRPGRTQAGDEEA